MTSAPSAEPPYLLIVAGPNGSGKSSAYQDADLEEEGRSVWIINPDLLAARIAQIESHDLPTANLYAIQRIETWLKARSRLTRRSASRLCSRPASTAAWWRWPMPSVSASA